MALSPSEIQTIERLRAQLDSTQAADELLFRYYDAENRLRQMGMAVPPEMRAFEVVTDGPRIVVDTRVDRQQVRSLVLPGEESADPQLRGIWDASNMDAHVQMFNRDRCIYGRSFLSVGSNEENPSLPLLRVESPREMAAEVDPRREVVTAAARFYGEDPVTRVGPTHVTLYKPDETVWVEKRGQRWVEVDRDPHRLGAVPIVMHLNRRMSSAWTGRSVLSRAILTHTDAAARTLTNMQFAVESHGIPRMWMTGVARGDFIDSDGKPIPQWEAYYDAIHTLTSEDAKIGQLTAADLKNFDTALLIYARGMQQATGYPASYFGVTTSNPAAEGAIRAEESRMVRRIEAENTEVGMTLGWAGALALRFATGEWVEGNRVRTEWHDPATPTVAQRMDATVKAYQSGIISREGAWDELGWSEARKAKERTYFENEALSDFSALRLIPDAPVRD